MKKTKKFPIEKQIKLYTLQQIKQADEFSNHEDLISALFNSHTLYTKDEVRNAIKEHLEREV